MTLALTRSHPKLLLATAIAAVLGVGWWLAPAPMEQQGAVADSSTPTAAAAPSADIVSRAQWVWGQPSPFTGGPAASSAYAPDPADEFAADVRHFEDLRAHIAERPQPDPELIQLARSLQFDLPQRLQRGDLSAAEALLLAGAMLEILEPDADERAQQLARLAAQVLPPVS
jgi:hypothetical protein